MTNRQNNQKPHQNISLCSCDKKSPLSLWLGSFGEYAKVKLKHQTPDFSTGSGGIVVAGDYSGVYPHPIGSGIAYARTHIHEDNGAGHANIDQGDVFIYGTFPIANRYFDTAVWGGYYHAKNVREISFSGYSAVKQRAKHTDGSYPRILKSETISG